MIPPSSPFNRRPTADAVARTRIAIAVSALIFVSTGFAEEIADGGGAPSGYELIWSDEFDGELVDQSRWLHRTNAREDYHIALPRNVRLDEGLLKISQVKEKYEGYSFTGGGVISQRTFRYGYFETRAKLSCTQGWHEAFWTTSVKNFPDPRVTSEPNIEIDVFEHYGTFDQHRFTYGVIEWFPLKGNLAREYRETDRDLAATFNVWAVEVTPDYLSFFFNGEVIHTIPMAGVPQNDFHIWLSVIATSREADPAGGETAFDYLRAYEIDLDSPTYAARREAVLGSLVAASPGQSSSGTDLWIEAEDFQETGPWILERDPGVVVLKGRTAPDANDSRPGRAVTMIKAMQPGTYRLWGRSRDSNTHEPGTRHFRVAVNGELSERLFGTHGKEGYHWQDGGTFELAAGLVTIELWDTSSFFARCDRLLLTTDLNFEPQDSGAPRNVEHWMETSELRGSRVPGIPQTQATGGNSR